MIRPLKRLLPSGPGGTAPVVTALIITAITFALRLWLLELRRLNPDELQHLHNAWCISKGLLPYRDYFEHHTPWLHFFLAPFFYFFNVETDFFDATRFILFSRAWMLLFTGGILILTFELGRLWRGRTVAFVSVAFLSITVMFLAKTTEVRPDVPSTLLLLASLVAVLHSPGRDERPRMSLRFALGGGFLGASVMCTQKVLFALPGLASAAVVYLAAKHDPAGFRLRLRNTLYFAAGILLPIAATAAYFYSRQGAEPFIELNFLLNLGWKARVEPWYILSELVQQNPFLVVLSVVGLLRSTAVLLDTRAWRRGDPILVLTTLSLVVGIFIIPVAHYQYTLTFLPLLSIVAADSLTGLVKTWFRLRGGKWQRGHAKALLFLLFSLASLALVLIHFAPQLTGEVFYPALWIVALLGYALGTKRSPNGAIALLLVVLSVRPLWQMRTYFEPKNQPVYEDLQYVLHNTAPHETVMDGFSGLGVFRPHAYFHYFLHGEIQAMLTDEQWRRLRHGLESGQIAPKLIFFDQYLMELPDELTDFLTANYRPLGREPIRALLYEGPSWMDEGPRRLGWPSGSDGRAPIPYVLAEEGWHAPEREGVADFRRSRGRRSRLLVPIGRPGDFTAAFRARLELTERPVSMELAVNGTPVGSLVLSAGWRHYRFFVPGALLERGFNEFLLTYSTTPYQVDPNSRGRNTVISVDYLQMERVDSAPR